jgi:hypothetical protein
LTFLRPSVNSEQRYREQVLSDERIDSWLDAYDLRERVIIEPEIRGSLNSVEVGSHICLVCCYGLITL